MFYSACLSSGSFIGPVSATSSCISELKTRFISVFYSILTFIVLMMIKSKQIQNCWIIAIHSFNVFFFKHFIRKLFGLYFSKFELGMQINNQISITKFHLQHDLVRQSCLRCSVANTIQIVENASRYKIKILH